MLQFSIKIPWEANPPPRRIEGCIDNLQITAENEYQFTSAESWIYHPALYITSLNEINDSIRKENIKLSNDYLEKLKETTKLIKRINDVYSGKEIAFVPETLAQKWEDYLFKNAPIKNKRFLHIPYTTKGNVRVTIKVVNPDGLFEEVSLGDIHFSKTGGTYTAEYRPKISAAQRHYQLEPKTIKGKGLRRIQNNVFEWIKDINKRVVNAIT